MQSARFKDLSTASDTVRNRKQILYAVASFLRKQISEVVIQWDKYPLSKDTSLDHSIEMMPPALTKFLYCLLDDGPNKENKEYELPIDKIRKCMVLAECIVSM